MFCRLESCSFTEHVTKCCNHYLKQISRGDICTAVLNSLNAESGQQETLFLRTTERDIKVKFCMEEGTGSVRVEVLA